MRESLNQIVRATISPFGKRASREICGGRLQETQVEDGRARASLCDDKKFPSVPLFQGGKCPAIASVVSNFVRRFGITTRYRDVVELCNTPEIFPAKTRLHQPDLDPAKLYWLDCKGDGGQLVTFEQMKSMINIDARFPARHIRIRQGTDFPK